VLAATDFDDLVKASSKWLEHAASAIRDLNISLNSMDSFFTHCNSLGQGQYFVIRRQAY
jgi:hypothetical protein